MSLKRLQLFWHCIKLDLSQQSCCGALLKWNSSITCHTPKCVVAYARREQSCPLCNFKHLFRALILNDGWKASGANYTRWGVANVSAVACSSAMRLWCLVVRHLWMCGACVHNARPELTTFQFVMPQPEIPNVVTVSSCCRDQIVQRKCWVDPVSLLRAKQWCRERTGSDRSKSDWHRHCSHALTTLSTFRAPHSCATHPRVIWCRLYAAQIWRVAAVVSISG